jgi:hypothetical protein
MYNYIKLIPVDGSTLSSRTDWYMGMVSLDGEITITFKGRNCWLKTSKGIYPLKPSHNGSIYYTTIESCYVCYNGAQLCWKKLA